MPRASAARPPVRIHWKGAAVGAACGLAALLLATQPFVAGLEEWLQDANLSARGVRPTRTKIVIVGIDDRTLRALPKPLAAAGPELARVVDYLHDRGAKVIALDVFVPDTLDAYDGEKDLGGAALGRAVARAGNVVMPMALGDDRLVRPLASWRTAEGYGLIEVDEDDDHFVRRLAPAVTIVGEPYPRLALAVLEALGRAGERDGSLTVDGRIVPLDAEGRMRINFLGPPGTVPRVSFADVLEVAERGGPPPADIRDAIVLVGATARSLGDWHATPYANGTLRLPWSRPPGLMTGSELQASAIATLADGAYITTPRPPLTSLLVVGLGALLGAVYARLGLSWGAGLMLAHHVGWKLAALVALWYGHRRIEMAAMLLTGALAYAAAFAWRWHWLRRLFGAVKSEAIARALEDDPGGLRLKGEERQVSVLFADIRDFTSFSEAHAPAEVVALLNAYFGEVVPILEAHGATVDKYIGDGIMALWNAPGDQPDHALRAARAAVAMAARVAERADLWAARGYPGMRIGVGVQTGPAVVGTIGSPRRLDYTAIGDTVNAAARIESETKRAGVAVLIGAATYADLPAGERAALGLADRPIEATVKGKLEPLRVYPAAGPAGRPVEPDVAAGRA